MTPNPIAIAMVSSCVISNGLEPRGAQRRAVKTHQTGFSLLEISVVIALAAMVSIGYLYNQSRENEINVAKAQAGYFLTLNDAVGNYMLQNYTYLKSDQLIPIECSELKLSAGDKPTQGPIPNCTFRDGPYVGNKSPKNVMQPTLADLKAQGVLDQSFDNSFLWKTVPISTSQSNNPLNVYNPNGIEPVGYAIRIERWCNGKLATNNNICAVDQFKSLIINTQPFADDDKSSFFRLSRFEKLNLAITSIGSDGFMSLDRSMDNDSSGKLWSVGKKTFLENPIKDKKNPSTPGIEGVLAVQNAVNWTCKAQSL